MHKTKPIITIAIPVFNAQQFLKICLDSIFTGEYPKSKLDVIIVDNESTDNTVKIARRYPVRILKNKIKDTQVSKMLAMRKAKGEYFMFLDSDITLVGKDWFTKMLSPMQNDKKIVASFCKFIARKTDPPLSRYLSYDTLQRDPIFEFLTPNVEDLIIEENNNYNVCKYELDKIPPSGVCLYDMKRLVKSWNPKKHNKFLDVDVLYKLVADGEPYFAYVKKIAIHHPFVKDLKTILKKRLRNIRRNYIKQPESRLYKWSDMSTWKGRFRVILWVVYANSIILPTISGIRKTIKNKDFACMYEPILSFTETWVIIYGMLRYTLFSYEQ